MPRKRYRIRRSWSHLRLAVALDEHAVSAERDGEEFEDLWGDWRAARRDELEPASESRADLLEDELVVDVERAGKRGLGRVELRKSAFKRSARERALEAWPIQRGSLTPV